MLRIKIPNNLSGMLSYFFWPTSTAFVLCAPYFVILIISNGYSPSLYQDGDEPFYLAVLQFASKHSFGQLVKLFPETPTDFPLLPIFYSHSTLDLLLGILLDITGIRGINFLHILDWTCIFVTFICYRLIFAKFSRIPLVADAAAVFAITYPYSMNVSQNILPSSLINLGLSSDREYFPSLPTMRGIYTQVSLIPFLYFLGSFLERITGVKGSGKKYFLLGCFTGILVYFYSFSWITIMALSSVIAIIANRFSNIELDLKRLLFYFSGSLLVAAPGVILSVGTRANMGMQKGIGGPFVPWLPLDYIFFLTLLYLVFHRLVIDNRNAWCLLFISVFITELVLRNLEFITNQIWAPYHFSFFFLRPLLVGLLMVPLVQLLIRVRGINVTRFILIGCCFFTLSINATECLNSYRAEKNIENLLRDLSNRDSNMKLGFNYFPLDKASIPGFAPIPLYLSNLTSCSAYFGEMVFREMFGAKPTGFPLLRTALVNGGYPHAFCNRIEAIVSQPQVNSILNWTALDIQNQCRELSKQLFALCSQDDWNKWYPNFLLLEESDYNKRLLTNKSVQPALDLAGQNEYHIITLTADSEKAEVCKNIN